VHPIITCRVGDGEYYFHAETASSHSIYLCMSTHMGESDLVMPNVWNHAHKGKKWISHWWASKFIASTAASVTTIAGFLFSTLVCCGKRYKAHQVGD
jgi:hypothetical protein